MRNKPVLPSNLKELLIVSPSHNHSSRVYYTPDAPSPQIAFSAHTVIFPGVTEVGATSKTASLLIYNPGEEPLVIDEAYCSGPFGVFNNFTLQPKQVGKLLIVFNPLEAGEHRGELRFLSNIHTHYTSPVIEVYADAVADVTEVDPFSNPPVRFPIEVVFDPILVFETDTKTAVLSNLTGQPVTVNLDTTGNAYSCSHEQVVIPRYANSEVVFTFSPINSGPQDGNCELTYGQAGVWNITLTADPAATTVSGLLTEAGEFMRTEDNFTLILE